MKLEYKASFWVSIELDGRLTQEEVIEKLNKCYSVHEIAYNEIYSESEYEIIYETEELLHDDKEPTIELLDNLRSVIWNNITKEE